MLLKKILDRFNGLYYPQEYLCLEGESFEQPLYASLILNHRVIQDITRDHAFVGYNPLIFALPNLPSVPKEQNCITVAFSQNPLETNVRFHQKDALAVISFKKIRQWPLESQEIVFYEGIKGRHRFLNPFHQSVIQMNNRLFNHKQGNVFLNNNLYKQVQIAYAIPRKISLITVGDGKGYNLFPTDLHGSVNQGYYVISLRHEGLACQQVCSVKRIALSDMPSRAYKQVYSFGKNHMKPLRTADSFDFDVACSHKFHLPLPQNWISYKELSLEDSFNRGIHKILLFKKVHQEEKPGGSSTLVHVHNCYATWRYNQGIAGNYLMR